MLCTHTVRLNWIQSYECNTFLWKYVELLSATLYIVQLHCKFVDYMKGFICLICLLTLHYCQVFPVKVC